MCAAQRADSIHVGRALPSELHVVLNGMPQRFFEDSPFLLHIQVARLISEGRFLIAQRGTQLLGGVAWQDDIAFGALYAKLLFVRDQLQFTRITARLMRELIAIGKEQQARAIFADLPEHSPLLKALDAVPGSREVGYIEDFGEPNVKSIMVQFDLSQSTRLIRHAERLIVKRGEDAEIGAVDEQ
jgi:hypothetical protein